MTNKIRMDSTRWLIAAGLLSTSGAVLHLLIIPLGAPAYRFFGAGEAMAKAAERGMLGPALITVGIASFLVIWAAYAFSGAGLIRRLPLLRTALVAISLVYLVRGMAPLAVLLIAPEQMSSFLLWSSLITFLFGLTYTAGTLLGWPHLAPKGRA